MHESEEELSQLQDLLNGSMTNSGAHMQSIFKREHWLSARQISLYLQGVVQVAAATVSSRGEPRVAPIDAVFYHGRFHLSTDVGSLRARHLSREPALSLAYFEGADPVILVHGVAASVHKNQPEFVALDSMWTKEYGKSVLELSDTVFFIRVDPVKMFAYSFHPERFPRN
jgi:uncharacterized pyridoxamine 5'-phosphate oxidase family protein